MFVYCVYSGDRYQSKRVLLSHQVLTTDEEFKEICDEIRTELINSTSKDSEIMDTVDGVKSIWEYSIDEDLLDDLIDVLIKEHGFRKLKDFPVYHVKGADPYDYQQDTG